MSQENVEIVRQVYDEPPPPSRRGLEERFDPDVEWLPASQSLLAGETYRGYEGIERFWEDLFSAWDEYRVEPEEFIAIGDQVVVVNRMRARTRGLDLDETWSSLFTLRDLKIVRFEGFTSRNGAREAAGLSD